MIFIQILGLLLALLLLVFSLVRYRKVFPYFLIIVYVYSFISYLPKFSVGPINIYSWDLLYLLAGLNILIRLLGDRSHISREVWIASGLCFLFMTYLVFSEVYNWYFSSSVPLDSLARKSIEVSYPLVVISVLFSLSRDDMVGYGKALLVGVMIIIARLFYIEVADVGGVVTSSGTVRRMPGEVILAMLFPVVYVLFQSNFNEYVRFALLASAVIAIALIGHRSGYLALLVIFGLFAVYILYTGQLARFLGRNILYLTFGSMCILIFAFVFKGDAIERVFERAADITDTSNTTTSDRLNKWKIALQTTLENPLGGTKLNLLPDYYGHRTAEAAFGNFDAAKAHGRKVFLQTDKTWPPHNMFINIVSKNGVVALVLFLSLVIYILTIIYRNGDMRYKFLCLAWISGNFVHLLFNNHHHPHANIFLFLSLMVFPLLFMKTKEKPSSGPVGDGNELIKT